ncbi:hypothetical protein ON010_g4524 [Phytophthora cinnamomi]|nr:hypothetical protein ON010_g4524 [Phytophthora cinnamomi]
MGGVRAHQPGGHRRAAHYPALPGGERRVSVPDGGRHSGRQHAHVVPFAPHVALWREYHAQHVSIVGGSATHSVRHRVQAPGLHFRYCGAVRIPAGADDSVLVPSYWQPLLPARVGIPWCGDHRVHGAYPRSPWAGRNLAVRYLFAVLPNGEGRHCIVDPIEREVLRVVVFVCRPVSTVPSAVLTHVEGDARLAAEAADRRKAFPFDRQRSVVPAGQVEAPLRFRETPMPTPVRPTTARRRTRKLLALHGTAWQSVRAVSKRPIANWKMSMPPAVQIVASSEAMLKSPSSRIVYLTGANFTGAISG